MLDITRKRLRLLGLLLSAVMAALGLSSRALSNSPSPEPPPPKEIRLSAEDQGRLLQLHEGEVLVISLEANPSTGYGWEVEQASLLAQGSATLVQTGDEFLEPEPTGGPRNQQETPALPLLGAPTTQVLRFQAVREGKTSLRLVYRRPWENPLPSGTFFLELEAIGPFTQPPPTPTAGTAQPASPLSVDPGEEGQLGLPSSLNWCDSGACTPVKDQGSCGSCWAFSTVGPLESNILHHGGVERDLSEQYLISCNTNGWDCSGGWFAHDHHEWRIPAGEPEAGAVYEAEFPYEVYQVPCNPPHAHHEKIVDWAYVGDSWSVPPAAAIKQAILDHGPVSVAIRIDSAFRNYTGGVFEINEAGGPNHAVVLVGWDDAQGTNGIWFLKNSWGSGWGEAGYMRIGYGISSVGYAANYVVYQPTCYGLNTQVYPAGTGTVVADPTPDCGDGGYEPSEVVELTPIAIPGWHFFAWGGDAYGSSNPLAITMDNSTSITAYFMCDECSARQRFLLIMMGYEQD
ncbi:MAG: protease inhibitor I42 family protein [Anaerolineae bacterium]|nr:protease inhibitor I42 family protein [Anaerolineae bacterium]